MTDRPGHQPKASGPMPESPHEGTSGRPPDHPGSIAITDPETRAQIARVIFEDIRAGRPVTDQQRIELVAFIYGK